MKKTILLLIVFLAICLPVFANNSDVVGNSQTDSDDETSQSGSIGHSNLTIGLFDVQLTIPKDYLGEITQENVDNLINDQRISSAILHSDGSITYVMTKAQYKKNLADLKELINQSLLEMSNSLDYPNITNVEANDNFTHYTLTTKNEVPDFFEGLSVLVLSIYSGLYSVYTGEKFDNVIFDFVNADSGEIVLTLNTDDFKSDT